MEFSELPHLHKVSSRDPGNSSQQVGWTSLQVWTHYTQGGTLKGTEEIHSAAPSQGGRYKGFDLWFINHIHSLVFFQDLKKQSKENTHIKNVHNTYFIIIYFFNVNLEFTKTLPPTGPQASLHHL